MPSRRVWRGGQRARGRRSWEGELDRSRRRADRLGRYGRCCRRCVAHARHDLPAISPRVGRSGSVSGLSSAPHSGRRARGRCHRTDHLRIGLATDAKRWYVKSYSLRRTSRPASSVRALTCCGARSMRPLATPQSGPRRSRATQSQAPWRVRALRHPRAGENVRQQRHALLPRESLVLGSLVCASSPCPRPSWTVFLNSQPREIPRKPPRDKRRRKKMIEYARYCSVFSENDQLNG
jgi:hypothetical protein